MELTNEERAFLLKPKALPTGTHYTNLRKLLPVAKWDKLRKLTYERAGKRCELCHAHPPRLEAHELWDFHFATQTQYLKRLVALCGKCHAIQHALLLKLHHDQGIKDAQIVVNHFNKLSKDSIIFDKFFALATAEHNKYENVIWNVIFVKEFDKILAEL